jgi:PAS domain S-box-containing protein
MTMMRRTATELVGWNVEAQPFLKAILDCVAQPLWVVDHEGLVRFANPAAVAALGYEDVSELEGKPSHETIHYKHPDGSPFPAEECPMLLPRRTGEAIHRDEDWFFRRDGTMFPVSYWSAPFDTPSGRGAVVAFTDIEEHRNAEQAIRQRDIAWARESEARAAQRRVIEAADAARRQVTRDLHDGAQQKLVNIVLNLQATSETWSSDQDRALALLETSTQQARAAITDLRNLAAGIHPMLLTTGGLRAAVAELAEQLPLPVDPLEIPEQRFPRAVEASVYFLISEALTNVVKHAAAKSAGVRIAIDGDMLTVVVSDDGVGGAEGVVGHGLAGLSDRVRALEGTLSMQSPPYAGTTVRAEIPVSKAAA